MTETYVVSSTGKPTITKDPNAHIDYPFDWSAWLADVEDTLNPAGCIALINGEDSDLITNVDPDAVWVEGGTVGETLQLTCRINTTGGRTDDRSVWLKIKER